MQLFAIVPTHIPPESELDHPLRNCDMLRRRKLIGVGLYILEYIRKSQRLDLKLRLV